MMKKFTLEAIVQITRSLGTKFLKSKFLVSATHPTTQNRNPLQAGVYALESSLTFAASVGFDGWVFGIVSLAEDTRHSPISPTFYLSAGSVLNGESSISFTSEKGAVLILPYEACREDTLYDEPFKRHMLRNYRQWYNFARERKNIKLSDLILVTGCDTTRQWATVNYSRPNRKMSAILGAPVGEVIFSPSEGLGLITTPSTNIRFGRGNKGVQNDSETLVNNQCVFLRGFHIKGRQKEVKDVWGDEDVTIEDLTPSTQVSS